MKTLVDGGGNPVGRFDPVRAVRVFANVPDWEQELWRTAGGRYYLSPSLLSDDKAISAYCATYDVRLPIGPPPASRGPGRPEVGPAVTIKFQPELLALIDAAAEDRGISRAEFIRQAMRRATLLTERITVSDLEPRPWFRM